MATGQQRSAFGGGGFFGRPVKMNPQTSPLGQPQSLVQPIAPPSPRAPTVQPAPAAPQSQALPFQAAAPASFPPKRIPMGPKGDCPICH